MNEFLLPGGNEKRILGGSYYTHAPYNTEYGAIAPRFSGSISIIGSSLLIYVILMSAARLSTSYHRIMFCTSVADILGSAAAALTTIPMPVNNNWYQPRPGGLRLGNTATCTAQGFFFIFGMSASLGCTVSLCVYYASTIAFGMNADRVKRKLEPMLLTTFLSLSSFASIIPLPYDMYNETPGSPWCTVKSLPNNCEEDDYAPKCERGHPKYYSKLLIGLVLIASSALIAAISSLILVCRKVYKQQKQLEEYTRQMTETHENSVFNNDRLRALNTRNTLTRAATLQSIAYITVFLLSVILPMLSGTNAIPSRSDFVYQICKKIDLVFQPMQGFLNFLVFIGSKVAIRRRSHPDLSIGQSLQDLFCTHDHSDDLIVVTGINFEVDEDGQLQPSNVHESGITSYQSDAWQDYVSHETPDMNSGVLGGDVSTLGGGDTLVSRNSRAEEGEGISTVGSTSQKVKRSPRLIRRGNVRDSSSIVTGISYDERDGNSQQLSNVREDDVSSKQEESEIQSCTADVSSFRRESSSAPSRSSMGGTDEGTAAVRAHTVRSPRMIRRGFVRDSSSIVTGVSNEDGISVDSSSKVRDEDDDKWTD